MATISFRFLSWNLKDFGNYDYSGTMSRIASTIIDSGADIAVILEVAANRRVKGAKIDQDLLTTGAENAVSDLLARLQKTDKKSGWMEVTSGINAGNAERDCYTFFWKSTPQGNVPGTLIPTKITKLEGPNILRKDAKNKELAFEGSRRPGACLFRLYNAKANPSTQDVWACGFHAYAGFSDPAGIQRSIKNCLTASNAAAIINPAPVVIGGDLNLDYTSYKGFYGSLQTDPTLGYYTALTDGTGSSLYANPDFSVAAPVVAGNAYDNFLYQKLKLVKTWKTQVIDVVAAIADELPNKSKKRARNELEEEAFLHYYTVNTSVKKLSKTSAISDHFPIIGAFGF